MPLKDLLRLGPIRSADAFRAPIRVGSTPPRRARTSLGCRLGAIVLGLLLIVPAAAAKDAPARGSRHTTSEQSPGKQPADIAKTDVVIVGAGIAGLVAAYELNKRGVRTHLLEAASVLGGRVATAEYDGGLRAEFGLQEIWANNPLVEIARELGVRLVAPYEHAAHTAFMHEGKIYPDVGDGSMRSHWDTFMTRAESRGLAQWLAAAEALHGRARKRGLEDPETRRLQSISFERWVHESPLLSPLARVWLRLHMEVELASDWSRVSALYALLELDLLFRGGASYYVVEGGNASLIEALARRAGPVTTSARVTAIKRRTDREGQIVVEAAYLQGNRIRRIEAQRAVLAVPFFRLHQIVIDPPLSEAHERALRSLGMGQYTVVHFLVDKQAAILETPEGVELDEGLLTNGPLGCVYGAIDSNEDTAIFSLLVYGDAARAFHMVPRATKIGELLALLDRIRPGFSGHVRDAFVYPFHPAALAVWGPGRSPLDEQSALLREPTMGLHLVGDYTRGGHSNSAAQSGLEAAERIAGELME